MVLFPVVVPRFVQPHLRMGPRRRRFPEVIGLGVTFCRTMDEEPAAADVSGRGMGHGQGKARGYGGINSVAALSEDLRAYL